MKRGNMSLKIGQNVSFSKTISEYDVYGYAGIIGDFNPVHVNQLVAEKEMFHDKVAHGDGGGDIYSIRNKTSWGRNGIFGTEFEI